MGGVDLEGKGGISLNLTPMVDMFSILNCFLLMNFSTQAESVETRAGLELPKSEIRMSLDTAASVSITTKEIVVQGGAVQIPIQANGDVAESELIQGGLKRAYDVFKQLKVSTETLKNRNQMLNLSEADISTLTLEADKATKFKLIKRVMLTAQQAEFVSWKLAVDKLSPE